MAIVEAAQPPESGTLHIQPQPGNPKTPTMMAEPDARAILGRVGSARIPDPRLLGRFVEPIE